MFSAPIMEELKNNPANEKSYKLLTEQELEQLGKEKQKTFLGSVFPVLKIEMTRFIVMLTAFSMIAFIYTFLRIYKDNIIYAKLEPAAQSYLKVLTAPVTFFFIGVLNKLLVRYDIDRTFDIGMCAFILVLAIQAVLIKIRYSIQPNELWALDMFLMDSATVRGFRPLFVLSLMLNQWVLSMLYILADVIGSIMVGYFFMTYINAHCTPDQNKRFVRVLYIFSNLAGFAAGKAMDKWSKAAKNMSYSKIDNFYFLFTILATVCFSIVLVLKKWLDYIFTTNPIVISTGKVKKTKVKRSVGFGDGIYFAWVSRLLWAMSIMTLIYNICNTFATSLFTNANKAVAPFVAGNNAGTFGMEQKSNEILITAIATVVVLLTPVSRLFEWFGVISSGGLPVLITFVSLSVTCLFACINYPGGGEDNMPYFRWLGEFNKHYKIEAWASLLTVSVIKLSKYAFFDIVKEAISMKIDPEIRPLFKSVFDGICGKLGKLIGSFYHIFMENITGGVLDARYFAPVTFTVTFFLCAIWLKQVCYLHRSFKKATTTNGYMDRDFIPGFNHKPE